MNNHFINHFIWTSEKGHFHNLFLLYNRGYTIFPPTFHPQTFAVSFALQKHSAFGKAFNIYFKIFSMRNPQYSYRNNFNISLALLVEMACYFPTKLSDGFETVGFENWHYQKFSLTYIQTAEKQFFNSPV